MKILASYDEVNRVIGTLKHMKEKTGKLDPEYVQLTRERLAHSYKSAVAYFYERLAEENLYKDWVEAKESEQ